MGHAGTLDPLATGLLIVCTGKGTKACDTFMAMSKSYSGVIRLGEGTATYDAEAEVSERQPWEHITDEDIQQAASSFTGDLMQVWEDRGDGGADAGVGGWGGWGG